MPVEAVFNYGSVHWIEWNIFNDLINDKTDYSSGILICALGIPVQRFLENGTLGLAAICFNMQAV